MKKIIISLVLVLCGIFFNEVCSEACPYSPSCVATSKVISCGTRHGDLQYTHSYIAVNGYVYICGVTNENAQHTIYCSGCGAVYGTEWRTCNTIHSGCGSSSYGLCQYQ